MELCRGSQECTTRGRTSRETLQPVSIRLFLICRTHKYFLFAADETPALVLSISHFGCRSFIPAALPVHGMAVPCPSTPVMFLPNTHTSELLLHLDLVTQHSSGSQWSFGCFAPGWSFCSTAQGAASHHKPNSNHGNTTAFGTSLGTGRTPHTSADSFSCHW